MKEAINCFLVLVRLSFEIGIVTSTSIRETSRFPKISEVLEDLRYFWINLNFLSLADFDDD